jgi:putative peptide zinc metalloprotease protein
MTESVFSSSWYRVENVHPRLRNHTQIFRHVYRGTVWYVMQNHITGRFHRFTPVANLILGLMDGSRTLAEIWTIACERLGDEVPSQDEIIKLLADLHQADALQSDAPPDMREMHGRRKKKAKVKLKQYIGNPLSLKIPLFDPDRIVTLMLPFIRPFFGLPITLVWLATVGLSIVLVGMNWIELSHNVIDRIFSINNLLLIVVIFPLIKLLHEFGHAIATKAGGGEVHEMGVMMLVLMPIPYVDASSATAFREKSSRVLVGAAGMLTELFIAAVAMVFWTYLDPGFERAIAYNVMMVAGVSTLLFNGNPLLRFDGYYILADYLEIPNLGQRSNKYIGYLIQKYLFGLKRLSAPVESAGEIAWFIGYAITSFIYRMMMAAIIIIFVASKLFFFGVVLALWAFINMLAMPALKQLSYLSSSPVLSGHRTRAIILSILIFTMIIGCLFLVPAPSSTMAQGVIWAPAKTKVRSQVAGFVDSTFVSGNQQVKAGEILFQLTDPELNLRVGRLESQLKELDSRYEQVILENRVQGDILLLQRQHLLNAINDAVLRRQDLTLRSPTDGIFVAQDLQNMIGRYMPRGEILAYINEVKARLVRVVVPQAQIDLVRSQTVSIQIRPADDLKYLASARIIRETPATTDELPSMILSLQGGGNVGMDSSNSSDVKSIDKLYVLDLEISADAAINNYLNSRVYVRFEHPPEPLAWQWYRGIRRMFLKKFNV